MPKLSDIVLFIGTVSVCLASLELGLRAYSGVPILELIDWRRAHLERAEGTAIARYDSVLGWSMKDDFLSADINLIGYGIRKNQTTDATIRTGGILAVGDSFTVGSQVKDGETWPAQLEGFIGEPVINAGVGGYGVDQMVLRAEQLLSLARPKTLIVGTQDHGILRVAFSSYGKPKPYFTIVNDRLVTHNLPVPNDSSEPDQRQILRDILGYSFLADQTIGAYNPGYWYSAEGQTFTKLPIDDVDVTCALLRRLKTETDSSNIRLLMLLQYGGVIANMDHPQPFAVIVSRCARASGIQVVDEFDSLHAIAARDLGEFKKYYIDTGDPAQPYGHMSALGNRHVAKLIAAALAEKPHQPIAAQQTPSDEAPHGRSGDFRWSASLETLPTSPIASLRVAVNGASGAREYELAAAGGNGEHYLALSHPGLPAGAYTLALEARPDAGTRLRLQLLDEKINGTIADFDFEHRTVVIYRQGFAQQQQASITPASDGWYDLSLMTALPEPGAHGFLQILDESGQTSFEPGHQAILLRNVLIEATRTSLPQRHERGESQ